MTTRVLRDPSPELGLKGRLKCFMAAQLSRESCGPICFTSGHIKNSFSLKI